MFYKLSSLNILQSGHTFVIPTFPFTDFKPKWKIVFLLFECLNNHITYEYFNNYDKYC